jgi:hypothetical protein
MLNLHQRRSLLMPTQDVTQAEGQLESTLSKFMAVTLLNKVTTSFLEKLESTSEMVASTLSLYLALAFLVVANQSVHAYQTFSDVADSENHNMLRRQEPVEAEVYDFGEYNQQRRELSWGFLNLLCK